MEELRSTEILDKEIQEDARRKAERILSNSATDCQAVLDSVKERVEKMRVEKKAIYKSKIDAYKCDTEAAIPLEKERFLVTYEDSVIKKAIDEYLQNLSDNKKLELIEKLLLRYKNALQNMKFNAVVSGFDIKNIEKLLEKIFGKNTVLSCSEKDTDTENFTGCLIETEDKSVKCRATIQEIVNEIVDKERYELAVTLFGGRLPE